MLPRPRASGSVVVLTVLLVACVGGSPPAASRQSAAAAPPAAGAAPPASAPAATAPAPAAPVALTTLKIAAQPSIPSAPRYVAMERGYLQEEGIELEHVPSVTSAQMLPALAAGQVDMGLGGATSGLFNAIAQGIPVRIALDMWTAYPGDRGGGLIARKDLVDGGQLRDYRDLRGLRVGITAKGHATEYALAVGLARAGLSLTDVETTDLSYPDMTVALGNRNIEAAVSIEPYASLAVAHDIAARFKPWSELVPYDSPASIMFSEVFAESRNDLARRFAKAYVRGLRDFDQMRIKGKDREEIIAITQKYVPFLERPIYDIIPWPSNNPDGRVNVDAIAAAQDWFFERGYVQTRVDLGKVVDNQFADYAVAQLGPYRP